MNTRTETAQGVAQMVLGAGGIFSTILLIGSETFTEIIRWGAVTLALAIVFHAITRPATAILRLAKTDPDDPYAAVRGQRRAAKHAERQAT